MSSSFETILYERSGHVARITLNRPEKLNAINARMESELKAAFSACQDDDTVRALVITGKGRGFCSGEDLEHVMQTFSPASGSPDKPINVPPAGAVPRHLADVIEKPVIAAVNGVCAGAGYAMALASDVRIASDRARFVHAYFRRALVPSCEAWYLPRIIGLGQAIYHIFAADEIGAEEALRINLVSKVVPADRLDEEVGKFAERLAEVPPTTVKFAKKAIYKSLTEDMHTAMDFVAYARALAMSTGETAASSRAFLDKRKPG